MNNKNLLQMGFYILRSQGSEGEVISQQLPFYWYTADRRGLRGSQKSAFQSFFDSKGLTL